MLRIATWNVQAGGRLPAAPRHLAELGVDVTLLQEADGQATWAPAQVFHVPRISRKRHWATGIAAHRGTLSPRNTLRAEGSIWELHRTIPGSIAVAEYEPDDHDSITVVGLYGAMENRWAYPTLLRQLADLSPLLYSRRKQPLLIGGDFNAGATKLPTWRKIHRPLWQTLEAFGLTDLTLHTASEREAATDCPCTDAPDCGHLPTQKPRTGTHGLQVENLWCTPPMLKRLVGLEVADAGSAPFALSDHRPLIASFDCD